MNTCIPINDRGKMIAWPVKVFTSGVEVILKAGALCSSHDHRISNLFIISPG